MNVPPDAHGSPDDLLALADAPEALEARFRTDPAAFTDALAAARAARPDDLVLRAWAARLTTALPPPAPDSPADVPAAGPLAAPIEAGRLRAFTWLTLGLALAAGTYAKLPAILALDEEWFYPRHLPFIVLPALVALVAYRYRPARRPLIASAVGIAALWLWQAVRPGTDASDVLILSVMHAPVLGWLLAAPAALGTRWRTTAGRMAYLQLTAEVAAVAGLIVLGGAVLTAVTLGLFGAIGVRVDEFWTDWVVPYGAAAVPLVALFVVSLRMAEGRIAPMLARFFGPLALAVLAVYLPVLLARGASPLEDRETLMVFDAMLGGVLVLVVLLVAARPDGRRHWTDGVVVGLAALALIADAVAVAALVPRLAQGLTPNRLALLGANVLVAVHLAGVLVYTARRLTGGAATDTPDPAERWMAAFLPAYAVWATVVVLLFPVVYGFG